MGGPGKSATLVEVLQGLTNSPAPSVGKRNHALRDGEKLRANQGLSRLQRSVVEDLSASALGLQREPSKLAVRTRDAVSRVTNQRDAVVVVKQRQSADKKPQVSRPREPGAREAALIDAPGIFRRGAGQVQQNPRRPETDARMGGPAVTLPTRKDMVGAAQVFARGNALIRDEMKALRDQALTNMEERNRLFLMAQERERQWSQSIEAQLAATGAAKAAAGAADAQTVAARAMGVSMGIGNSAANLEEEGIDAAVGASMAASLAASMLSTRRAPGVSVSVAALEKSLSPSQEEQYLARITELQALLAASEARACELADRVEGLAAREAELASLRTELQAKLDELSPLYEEACGAVGEMRVELRRRQQEVDEAKAAVASQAREVDRLIAQRHLDLETRRSLHNAMMDLRGKIRVAVRVRPPRGAGASGSSDAPKAPPPGDRPKAGQRGAKAAPVTSPRDQDSALYLFPDANTEGRVIHAQGRLQENIDGTAVKRQTHSFTFDHVFPPVASQLDVFGEVKLLVQSALDGYKVCIFSYGQTASGKTYTMLGPSNKNWDRITASEKGIIPRAVQHIFEFAEQMLADRWKYSLSGSFYELYLDQVRDLLLGAEDCGEAVSGAADVASEVGAAIGEAGYSVDVADVAGVGPAFSGQEGAGNVSETAETPESMAVPEEEVIRAAPEASAEAVADTASDAAAAVSLEGQLGSPSVGGPVLAAAGDQSLPRRESATETRRSSSAGPERPPGQRISFGKAVGPSKPLKILRDPSTGAIAIQGLTSLPIVDLESLNAILEAAYTNRATSTTKMNEHSSRSHAIFQLDIVGTNLVTGERREGQLNMVDLAGSENIEKSGATDVRKQEAIAINRSLSALGSVFAALLAHQPHVPFRDSKLTSILQPALTGESKTLMIISIAPEESNSGESLASLKFGQRVSGTELGVARRQRR